MYEYTFGELEGALVSRHLHISYMIVHGLCCHADESSRTKRSIEKVPTILLDCYKMPLYSTKVSSCEPYPQRVSRVAESLREDRGPSPLPTGFSIARAVVASCDSHL